MQKIKTLFISDVHLGTRKSQVDKLLDVYQADINQDTLDPNLISWIREKTKFIQWIAGKTSDL
jgi:UDP-2,3-diacylglucosamine pyrophosphatase LpxH